jgi:trans-AT polyketide synthase/acyltransferase/oxidoreductase domain-containing protein
VEAAGFTSPVPELVRYRLTGLRAGADGRPVPAHRLLAKVGRADVARLFLQPPPEETVRLLRARGLISEEEARLAPYLPMADDVCAETAPAGQGSAFSLLPAVRRAREQVAARHPALARVRIGVAGGLGSAEAVAAAFTMGADFVLTGSVNQCTPQAGTSDLVKDMLADADVEDFGTAPAAELLEQGGQAAVLRKGVLFPARAARLYELYLRHESLDDLSPDDREHAEKQCFGRTFADVWTEVRSQYADEDRVRLERIERNPQARLALTVRWYLLDTLRRAQVGDPAERLSFQVRSGPAMGAFNHEVRGTELAHWRRRHVDDVAWFLMRGAARVVREHSRLVHPAPEPVGAHAGV